MSNIKQRPKFKDDKFKKSRGGYSRWLLIYCEKCNAQLLIYQKDGPGILKRLYYDRILAPLVRSGKTLVCKKCKAILGVSVIYKKEKRPAYRLFAGAVGKKVISQQQIPRTTSNF